MQSFKKVRKTRSKAGSKKGNSLVGSAPASTGELEEELERLEVEEREVDTELQNLEDRDRYSSSLHKKALNMEIEFIEDLQVPEGLEKDEVWNQVNEDHQKRGQNTTRTVETHSEKGRINKN